MKHLLLGLSLAICSACSSSHGLTVDVGSVDGASVDAREVDGGAFDGGAFDGGTVSLSCPPGIDAYAEPYEACDPEGATCSESSVCGSALSCQCIGGLWNCAFAHPDPVCTCGRQPTPGDPCIEEGSSCGECCPAGEDRDAPAWAPMVCTEGTWQPALCAPECEEPPPSGSCSVNPRDDLGGACSLEAQRCGNPCCGTAIVCRGGAWEAGPEAACACTPQRECGTGSCSDNEYCVQTCGPADGPEYFCNPLPAGCTDCSCIPVDPGLGRCEMVNGAPAILQICG